MPLPFLKPKSVAGLIISQRKPDGGKEEQHQEGNEDASLDACSEDLIRAVTAKDAKSVSAAIKAAFQILDSQEDESEEEMSNDYESQNAKAANEERE